MVDLLFELDSSDLFEVEKISRLVAGELKWQPQYQGELLKMIHKRLEKSTPFISPELLHALSGVEAITLSDSNKLTKIHKEELTLGLMYKLCLQSQFTFRHTREMIKSDFSFPAVVTENKIVDLGDHSGLMSELRTLFSTTWMQLVCEDNILPKNGFITPCYEVYTSQSIEKYSKGFSELTEIDNDVLGEMDNEGKQISDLSLSKLSKNEQRRIRTLISRIEAVADEFGTDPKTNALCDLVGTHVGKERQVLVFSRVTDTTSVIEETLNNVGRFSGARFDGSTIRDREPGDAEASHITKEQLIDLMFEGTIDVVVCSDAASEGLNLQSASVLINVDVPWNPARLLQRIGRIDRLGQKNKQIFIQICSTSIQLQECTSAWTNAKQKVFDC